MDEALDAPQVPRQQLREPRRLEDLEDDVAEVVRCQGGRVELGGEKEGSRALRGGALLRPLPEFLEFLLRRPPVCERLDLRHPLADDAEG